MLARLSVDTNQGVFVPNLGLDNVSQYVFDARSGKLSENDVPAAQLAQGAKTIPGAGLYGLPSRLHVPGAVLTGDCAGFVDMASLKGVNYAIRSGMLAADAIAESLEAGNADAPAGLWGYDKRIHDSEIWTDLWKVRNIRPAFQKGFAYGSMVHMMATGSGGRMPKQVKFIADAAEPVFEGEVEALVAPGSEGYLGILEQHAPLITALMAGQLEVTLPDGSEQLYFVTGGFLEVSQNRAIVLADALEPLDSIDGAAAQTELDQLRAARPSADDVARAEQEIAQARARVRAARRQRGEGY